MSDIFNHELDAWDSYDRSINDGEVVIHNSDPNYYHDWVNIESLVFETKKAYLIKLTSDLEIWVPKKIIKKIEDKRIYVHLNTFTSILKNKINELKTQEAV